MQNQKKRPEPKPRAPLYRPSELDQTAREDLNYWLARIKLKALRSLMEGKTDV